MIQTVLSLFVLFAGTTWLQSPDARPWPRGRTRMTSGWAQSRSAGSTKARPGGARWNSVPTARQQVWGTREEVRKEVLQAAVLPPPLRQSAWGRLIPRRLLCFSGTAQREQKLSVSRVALLIHIDVS